MRYSFEPRPACLMCGSDHRRLLGLRLNCTTGTAPRAAEGIGVPIKQCDDCGLIYPDPLPIPASIADHYGTPPEDYWGEEYLMAGTALYADEIVIAKELLNFTPGMASLDIGAGIGTGICAFSEAGFQAYGVEPSEPFYRRALERVSCDKLVMTTVEQAGFPAASFDYIGLGAVLEHLYDPAAVLERALFWLRPSGIIFVEVPNATYTQSRLLNAYYRLCGTNYVTNCSPMHSPFHLYEFTLQSFDRHAERAGYTIARHHTSVGTIRHIPRLAKPLLRWWMNWRETGNVLSVWLRKALD